MIYSKIFSLYYRCYEAGGVFNRSSVSLKTFQLCFQCQFRWESHFSVQCICKNAGTLSMGKSLVQEFITDEFKTVVQAVLDKALHGEETTYVVVGLFNWMKTWGALYLLTFWHCFLDIPILDTDTPETSSFLWSLQLVLDLMSFLMPLLDGTKKGISLVSLVSGKMLQVSTLMRQGRLLPYIYIAWSSVVYRPHLSSTARLAQERECIRLIDTVNAPIFGVDNTGRINLWK